MDLSNSIIPNSDQLNAEDLLAAPMTVTIEKVTAGSSEQPVNVHLVELPGRPYRPSKSMRRVMVDSWGPEASNYTGRRMTLYRDPDVKFGGMAIGGIKISHLSHIDGPREIALTVTRGKRAMHHVDPLTEAQRPTEPTAEQVAACTDEQTLRDMWKRTNDPAIHDAIRARVEQLRTAPEDIPDEEFERMAQPPA